jgi:hypothetical protein
VPSDAGLQEIVVRLRASRVRLIAGRVFQTVVWAVLIGLFVRALLDLLRHVDVSPMADGASMYVALTVFAVVLMAGTIHVWRTSPDLLHVAAMADRQHGLQERLSTAIEVQESGGARSAVAAALLADVSARAATLRSTAMVTRSRPRQGAYLGATVAAILVLHGLPLVIAPAVVPTSAERSLSAEARSKTAANLLRASALVRRDAERRNDLGLRSLADDLEKLQHDIELGRLDDEEMVVELQRIIGGLARAYDMRHVQSDATAMTPVNLAGGGSSAMEERSEGNAPEPRLSASTPDFDDLHDSDIEQAFRIATTAIDDVVSMLETALSDDHQASPAVRDVDSVVGIGSDVRFFDYDEVDPELQARLEESRRILASLRPDVPLGGEMGGAGDGASVQPGAGSQPLLGDENEGFLDWDSTSSENVELPFDEQSTRRIRIEAPPEEQVTTVDAAARSGGSWRRSEERAIPRGFIGPDRRAAVRSYFLTYGSVDEP